MKKKKNMTGFINYVLVVEIFKWGAGEVPLEHLVL